MILRREILAIVFKDGSSQLDPYDYNKRQGIKTYIHPPLESGADLIFDELGFFSRTNIYLLKY